MKRILKSLILTIVIVGVGCILFLEIKSRLDHYFFAYNFAVYQNEIDSLFQSQHLRTMKVQNTYKSGENGAIYYVNVDTLSNISIIETLNYHEVFLKGIDVSSVEKIELSQAKTYTAYVKNPFPIVQQALNPRESKYLNITIEDPFQLTNDIKNRNFRYIKGNFVHAAFGNTQNCSIITFQGNKDNEILVIDCKGKLYLIMQTVTKKSLLELINLKNCE